MFRECSPTTLHPAAVCQLLTRLTAAADKQPQPGWSNNTFPPAPSVQDINGTFTGPRLVVYSAHDVTVAAFLSALGIFDG